LGQKPSAGFPSVLPALAAKHLRHIRLSGALRTAGASTLGRVGLNLEITDLNRLIDSSDPWSGVVILVHAAGINDKGEIV